MQFSADENLHFIGCTSGKSGDKEFYRVTLSAEDGTTVRFYTDAVNYGKCQALKWGDDITPVLRVYEGRTGIGATMIDFILPVEYK